jgi:hypothetical protein
MSFPIFTRPRVSLHHFVEWNTVTKVDLTTIVSIVPRLRNGMKPRRAWRVACSEEGGEVEGAIEGAWDGVASGTSLDTTEGTSEYVMVGAVGALLGA